MRKLRLVLGLLAGGLLLLSSIAHSVLGWAALQTELDPTGIGPDLRLALGISWRLGGAAMIAFGTIVIATMLRLRRGEATWTFPATVIGLVYLLYGAWAWVLSGFDPFFFLLFVLPGAMVVIATTGHRAVGR